MDKKIYVKEHQEKKQKMGQSESIYPIYGYQKEKIVFDKRNKQKGGIRNAN